MIDHLGYILRFTNVKREHSYSVIVDFHVESGLYGIRRGDKDSNVTLWVRVEEAQPGTSYELLPPDTPVQWRNAHLRWVIQSGEIDEMAEASRLRLIAEKKKRRDNPLSKLLR